MNSSPIDKIRCLLDVAVDKDSICYYCCKHCERNETCELKCHFADAPEEQIIDDCIHAF